MLNLNPGTNVFIFLRQQWIFIIDLQYVYAHYFNKFI